MKNIIISLLLGSVITLTVHARETNKEILILKKDITVLTWGISATADCMKKMLDMIKQEKLYVL